MTKLAKIIVFLCLTQAAAAFGSASSASKTAPFYRLHQTAKASVWQFISRRQLGLVARCSSECLLSSKEALRFSSYLESQSQPGNSEFFLKKKHGGWQSYTKNRLVAIFMKALSRNRTSSKQNFYRGFLKNTTLDKVRSKYDQSLKVERPSDRLAGLILDIIAWSHVWEDIEDEVGDEVVDQASAEVRAQVWAEVWAEVWDQVGDQVRRQVERQVGRQVEAQVWARVRAQVWADLSNLNLTSEFQQGNLGKTLKPVIEKAFLAYHFVWSLHRFSPEYLNLRSEVAEILRARMFEGQDKTKEEIEREIQTRLSKIELSNSPAANYLIDEWLTFLHAPLAATSQEDPPVEQAVALPEAVLPMDAA